MSRVVIVGLVVAPVLGLLGSLAYWKTSARPAPPAHDSTRAEVASLRAELASLKANSAAALLLAQQSAQLGQQKSEKTAAPAADKELAPSQASAAAEAPLTQAEVAVFLDNTFDAEPMDPAWGQTATLEATRALSAGIPDGTTVRGVQCRTTLCRVETSHKNLDDFRAFATGSLLGRERRIWNGGVSTQVREESATGVTAVTYIAKEGQSVPVPEHD